MQSGIIMTLVLTQDGLEVAFARPECLPLPGHQGYFVAIETPEILSKCGESALLSSLCYSFELRCSVDQKMSPKSPV